MGRQSTLIKRGRKGGLPGGKKTVPFFSGKEIAEKKNCGQKLFLSGTKRKNAGEKRKKSPGVTSFTVKG